MLIYLQLIDNPRDKATFEDLYYRYRGLMFHTANKILRNRDDAEDAVHQAFLSIAEGVRRIPCVNDPRTRSLVVLITERRAIDLLRRRRDGTVLSLGEEDGSMEVPLPGDYGLADAMARLPAEARELLLLHFDNGYTVRELAAMLELSEAAVYKRLARAKEQLKQTLEEEEIDV